MGFKTCLVHGMYNAAKVIALVDQSRATSNGALRSAFKFKTPSFLPGDVELKWESRAQDVRLILHNVSDAKPILEGRLHYGNQE